MSHNGDENWINIYWKNRDDPLFEYLSKDTRDYINGRLQNNFIVEKGVCCVDDDYLYIEAVKLASKMEVEEWGHRTRFKSVMVKALVGIEAQEIRVDLVTIFEVENKSAFLRNSEDDYSTLFCLIENSDLVCELYEGPVSERVNTGQVRFCTPGEIEKRKESGLEILLEGEDPIFQLSPYRSEKVDSIVFEDVALVYSKQLKKDTIEISMNPSTSQIEKYGT